MGKRYDYNKMGGSPSPQKGLSAKGEKVKSVKKKVKSSKRCKRETVRTSMHQILWANEDKMMRCDDDEH
jgi:hypothetical protein